MDKLTITASASDKTKVSGVAYTGGKMSLPGWKHPVVVDLSGLTISDSVPLLCNHENAPDKRIGLVCASVDGTTLTIDGEVFSGSRLADGILAQAKAGGDWQLSLGAEVLDSEFVSSGSREINGQAHEAPFYHIKQSLLREVSVVALGADSQTRMKVAAIFKLTGLQNMENKTIEASAGEAAAVATERQRVKDIKAICMGEHERIEAAAIEEGWDTKQTSEAVLKAIRSSRPMADISFVVHAPSAPPMKSIEAAFLMRLGEGEAAEQLGERVCGAADRFRNAHALDLCRAALAYDGVQPIGMGRMELVQAALSSYSLPQALGNVANRLLLKSYNETPASWRSFAHIRNVADFRTQTAIRPTYTGSLEPVAAGGELVHGSLRESTMEYSIDTFGKLFGVDRRDLINDDLGVFHEAASAMGRAAARKLNDLVYTTLLNGVGSFFTGDNYISGTDSTLNNESLANAIAVMSSQRDDEGNDLDMVPVTLLVPPELAVTAKAILESEFIQRAVNEPTGNSLRRSVSLKIEPRLSNSVKFGSKASEKHWFLFADKSNAPMIVAFLNGKQSPTVEYFGLNQTVDTLGVSWRVYHDFGAAMCDPRAALMVAGE